MNKIDEALRGVLSSHEVYIRKVCELFDLIENKSEPFECVKESAEKLKEINDLVRATVLFERSQDKYSQFLQNIKKEFQDKKERVEAAWVHFLEKAVEAPTSLHRVAAVICIIPVIWDLYTEFLNEEPDNALL